MKGKRVVGLVLWFIFGIVLGGVFGIGGLITNLMGSWTLFPWWIHLLALVAGYLLVLLVDRVFMDGEIVLNDLNDLSHNRPVDPY